MSTSEVPEGQPDQKRSMPRWLGLGVALFFWLVGLPLAHGALPWAISGLTPRYGWVANRPGFWNLPGLVPVIVGTACLLWIMGLHLAQTPERVVLERTPRYLLRRGPYTFTRNPMYLAELALWLGWALFFGSVSVLVGFVVLWGLMNFIAVPREERELEARFGEAYREYSGEVPRWL